MLQRHPRKSNPSPSYEDAGLFKNAVCEVSVELVPMFARNSREDVVVAGFVEGDLEVSVVFAGRRLAQARTLILALKALKISTSKQAQADGQSPVALTDMRYPVQFEGAWRSGGNADPEGWPKRSDHFVAAQWSYQDAYGVTVHSGSVPELGVPVAEPQTA